MLLAFFVYCCHFFNCCLVYFGCSSTSIELVLGRVLGKLPLDSGYHLVGKLKLLEGLYCGTELVMQEYTNHMQTAHPLHEQGQRGSWKALIEDEEEE